MKRGGSVKVEEEGKVSHGRYRNRCLRADADPAPGARHRGEGRHRDEHQHEHRLFGASPIGTNGAIITGISAIPNNSVTAQWCACYYSTDSGTTLRVFAIGTMASYTAAATLGPTPLNLTHMDGSAISPTNSGLYAALGLAPALCRHGRRDHRRCGLHHQRRQPLRIAA